MHRSPSLPIYRQPPDDVYKHARECKGPHGVPLSRKTSISKTFNVLKNHKPRIIIKGAWITSEMTCIGDSNEQKVKCSLIEFGIFLVYLIILMIVVFAIHPENQYNLTHAMEKAFLETYFTTNDIRIKYADIIDAAAMYNWMTQVFVPQAFTDTWYTNRSVVVKASSEDRNFLYENKAISKVRLQAISVLPKSCKIFPAVKNYFNKCFAYYSPSVGKDRGNEKTDYANGKLSWYPQTGSFIDLPSRAEALAGIIALQNSLWIARGVRAVILHYNLYNVNLNCFCFIKFVFEVPPTGGFIPSWNIHITKVLKYVTAFDFFVFGLELGLIIFVIIYTIEEFREMMFFRLNYLNYFWNWIDLFILFFSFLIVFILFMQAAFFPYMVESRLKDFNKYYTSYFEISRYNKIHEVSSALIIFLAWCKVFKFMKFTNKMDFVVETLKQIDCQLFHFGLLTIIFFLAFSFWGFFLFHSAFEEYSTLFNTFLSLLRMCHGDYDFNALRNEDNVFGPIFIITFITLFYFLIANLIVAIIYEAYQTIKENQLLNDVTPLNFLSRAYYNMFCRRKKKVKIYKEICSSKITYTEMYNMLKSMNFTQEEISMFFSKYNIQSNQNKLSARQLDEIISDLKIRKFIPSLPQDLERYQRIKEKRSIRAEKEKRFNNAARYHVFTYTEYDALQAQLDQLEILLELSNANLYELLKIFESGVMHKWIIKEKADPNCGSDTEPLNSDTSLEVEYIHKHKT